MVNQQAPALSVQRQDLGRRLRAVADCLVRLRPVPPGEDYLEPSNLSRDLGPQGSLADSVSEQFITVKPVYNGHSMEKQKVAVAGR